MIMKMVHLLLVASAVTTVVAEYDYGYYGGYGYYDYAGAAIEAKNWDVSFPEVGTKIHAGRTFEIKIDMPWFKNGDFYDDDEATALEPVAVLLMAPGGFTMETVLIDSVDPNTFENIGDTTQYMFEAVIPELVDPGKYWILIVDAASRTAPRAHCCGQHGMGQGTFEVLPPSKCTSHDDCPKDRCVW